MIKQVAYCQYLRDWANSHTGVGSEGMSPACFDEWEHSEGRETSSQLTKTFFVQVNYSEQDSEIHDTAALLLPETVSEEELLAELERLTNIYGDEKYGDEDMLGLTDEMLNELVSLWKGTWHYLNVSGVMEVNGYERTITCD